METIITYVLCYLAIGYIISLITLHLESGELQDEGELYLYFLLIPLFWIIIGPFLPFILISENWWEVKCFLNKEVFKNKK